MTILDAIIDDPESSKLIRNVYLLNECNRSESCSRQFTRMYEER